jgi:tRNA-specific 2-thiouridylase
MTDNSQIKVIVGMSGGVDSSVSAYLLQQQGYQVEGLFMKNWEEDDTDEYCSAAQDLADAKAVCDKLGMKLHTINFAAEYWDNVFEHFLEEYKAGRTPNPDILCNKEIKFKAFLEFAAEELGATYIATGHYVRRDDSTGRPRLLRGLDTNKDQSYFLHPERSPGGSEPVPGRGSENPRCAASPSSWISSPPRRKTPPASASSVSASSRTSWPVPARPARPHRNRGRQGHRRASGADVSHPGPAQGLGIGGRKDATEEAWYVVDKEVERNTLVVAQGEHPAYSDGLVASQLHWVDRTPFARRAAAPSRPAIGRKISPA